jgi:hypothetical protein
VTIGIPARRCPGVERNRRDLQTDTKVLLEKLDAASLAATLTQALVTEKRLCPCLEEGAADADK